MQELKCPNCGKFFQIDESGYDQLLKQVRDAEFEKELDIRQKELLEKQEIDLKLQRIKQEKKQSDELLIKDNEIAKEAEFFCFGTNDLTQMTYGFSRDDAGKFLDAYYLKTTHLLNLTSQVLVSLWK